MNLTSASVAQPFGAPARVSPPPAAAPPVLEKERLRLGTFAKVLLGLYVAGLVLFPPTVITGGFGTLMHGGWIVMGFIGATPLLMLLTLGSFFVFGRSSRAANVAFCMVMMFNLLMVVTMPVLASGLVRAREKAMEIKAREAKGLDAAEAARASAVRMLESGPGAAPAATRPRGDKPPPIITVRRAK